MTARQDLQEFRQRENKRTEEIRPDFPDPGAITYFWTMGSNLDRFPEFNDLRDDRLANALAERARRIIQPGRDGVLASDYIRRVHEFDLDDPFTAEIVRHL